MKSCFSEVTQNELQVNVDTRNSVQYICISDILERMIHLQLNFYFRLQNIVSYLGSLIMSVTGNTDLISIWSLQAPSSMENQLCVESQMYTSPASAISSICSWNGLFLCFILNSCRMGTCLAFMLLKNFLYKREL